MNVDFDEKFFLMKVVFDESGFLMNLDFDENFFFMKVVLMNLYFTNVDICYS